MQDSNSEMTITWTEVDLAEHKKREINVHQQNIVEKELDNKTLPTDIHVIDYIHNGQRHADAVRAAKMCDIFDVYYDKLKELGGGSVLAIKSGYGSIKPKLYDPNPKENKKEKK